MEVKFPRYRTLIETRVTANNAMLALLAGSRLASNSLQLNAGSTRLLPEIYPAVRDIDRFNLVIDSARTLLNDADSHLAAVAVPYALAIHEDFVTSTIDLVRAAGTPVRQVSGRSIRAHNMHESLLTAISAPLPATSLEVFHLLREMRNSAIHEGGIASSRLLTQIQGITPAAELIWLKIATQGTADIVEAGRVKFSVGHLIAAFAATKQLARDVNSALQMHWGRNQWAEIAVGDFVSQTSRPRNSEYWKRGLIGYARTLYHPIGLTDSELESAARSLNSWTGAAWA